MDCGKCWRKGIFPLEYREIIKGLSLMRMRKIMMNTIAMKQRMMRKREMLFRRRLVLQKVRISILVNVLKKWQCLKYRKLFFRLYRNVRINPVRFIQ